MNLKIKESVPLKYLLNMHLIESLIDRDSIAFEIVKYVDRDIDANGKDRIIENFKFSSRTLKYIFGDRMKNDEFKIFLIEQIKSLIKDDLIKPNGKSMYINIDMLNKFYTIS